LGHFFLISASFLQRPFPVDPPDRLAQPPEVFTEKLTFILEYCGIHSMSDCIAERILDHADKSGYLDGYLPVNRRYGEISDVELIRAIDRLTSDHGASRINDSPIALKLINWVLAGGRFSGNSSLDTGAESL